MTEEHHGISGDRGMHPPFQIPQTDLEYTGSELLSSIRSRIAEQGLLIGALNSLVVRSESSHHNETREADSIATYYHLLEEEISDAKDAVVRTKKEVDELRTMCSAQQQILQSECNPARYHEYLLSRVLFTDLDANT